MIWSRHVAPAPALRPYVAWYSAYQQDDGVPGRHRGLPSPYLTLIITVGAPLTVEAHPDPRDPGGDFRTLIGGLHATPAMITHPGRQAGIQVALEPLGTRALFGVPAGDLANRDFTLPAVLGPSAGRLYEQINAAPTWSERLRTVDTALLAGLDPSVAVPPELTEAWRMLRSSAGRVDIGAVAGEIGWSARHLRGRFDREIGLGPKAAARVIRFDRARRLVAVPGANLADVAVRAGYYDQAHLAREFRDIAGCPPSRFRFVQARSAA